MKHNKDVEQQDVKMYCVTDQFTQLKFLRPHKKTHGVCGLGNNYYTHFDTKLGHGIYTISRIPCTCTSWTYSIDQPWIPGFTAQKQPRYQPIKNGTDWTLLVYFNNRNIIKL